MPWLKSATPTMTPAKYIAQRARTIWLLFIPQSFGPSGRRRVRQQGECGGDRQGRVHGNLAGTRAGAGPAPAGEGGAGGRDGGEGDDGARVEEGAAGAAAVDCSRRVSSWGRT